MGGELQIRDAYRAQQWAEIIRECQASGLSNREFCRQRGITEKTYYYWLRKLRGAISEEFIPQLVKLEDESPVSDSMIRIQFGQAQLTLPAGTDVDAIAAVLRALQRQ